MTKHSHNPALSGPIIRTFFYFAVPSLIGLVAITTANLVDGLFVGNFVGSEALAAITFLIPYFTLLFGSALMLAIGGSVRVGKYMGENNTLAASAMFSKTLIATACFSLLLALITIPLQTWIFSGLGAPVAMHNLMADYFDIIRWALVIQLTTMVLYYFVRADGFPMLATGALVVGAALNIALDAFFIGYWGLGLKGAAYATTIAQLIQLGVLCLYFLQPKKSLLLTLPKTHWREIATAAYNGVSEFINEISAGIVLLVLNWLLVTRAGIDGVAAFTVVNYAIFLSLMLSYGIADALHLLVSQNFGAKHYQRMQHFFITAISTVAFIGLSLAWLLLWLHQAIIPWFLGPDEKAIAQLSAKLVALIWPIFLVNGCNVVLSCYLTAVHQPRASASVAIARSLVLPIAFLVALAWLMEQNLLPFMTQNWDFIAALPLAEWTAFALASWLFAHYRPIRLAE